MNKTKPNPKPLLLVILLPSILSCQPAFAVDFVFNGFNSSDMLLLYSNATVESRTLTLTNNTNFSIGRALYKSKIPTKEPNSSYVYPFSTSFILHIAPYKNTLAGHGMVFIFVPQTGIKGTSSSEHLGLFNFTNGGSSDNHVFGVEFDVFKNEEFTDISDNHVGIDLNSLQSVKAHEAGFWPENSDGSDEKSFKKLKLNSGENYQVWIDYKDLLINVTMVRAGAKRPKTPLLSFGYNLSDVLLDEMFIGFTSSTGQLVESHRVLAWSFSNSNFSLSESLITSGLPSFVLPKSSIFASKGFIAGITVGGFFVICIPALFSLFLVKRHRRLAREREEMEDWELEYWPHRITYQEIEKSTKGFDEENVIGVGGNGKVYKGVLAGGAKIAVKCISHENDGMREFLAEISSIGRLKHRNLVGLRGWCKREKGRFMVVYDYMENGSLDKRVFDCDENKMLNFEDRIRALKDVASGVLYLHEGWESKVLHRDIKASNVLLDKEMNGRLGDFGLARMHGHGEVLGTTRVGNPTLAQMNETEREQKYIEGYNAYMRELERQSLKRFYATTSCEIISVSSNDEEEEEQALEDHIIPICPICAEGCHVPDYCPWRDSLPKGITEVPKGYAIGCVLCGNVHNKCKHNWGVVIDVECYICDTEGDHLTLECPKIEAKCLARIDARAREVEEAEKGKEGAAKDRAKEGAAKDRARAGANGTLECLLCHEKGDHLYWDCPRLITAGLTKVKSEGAKGKDGKRRTEPVLKPHLVVWDI